MFPVLYRRYNNMLLAISFVTIEQEYKTIHSILELRNCIFKMPFYCFQEKVNSCYFIVKFLEQ